MESAEEKRRQAFKEDEQRLLEGQPVYRLRPNGTVRELRHRYGKQCLDSFNHTSRLTFFGLEDAYTDLSQLLLQHRGSRPGA